MRSNPDRLQANIKILDEVEFSQYRIKENIPQLLAEREKQSSLWWQAEITPSPHYISDKTEILNGKH